MAKLAGVFAFVQFNITLTGVVDTALAGRGGTLALAACGLGSAFFMATAVLVLGVGFGVEPFVAQALGAERPEDARRWLWQGLYVAFLASLPVWLVGYLGSRSMSHFGISSELAAGAHDYLVGRLPSIPLFGLMSVLRAYLQACHCNRPIVIAAVAMNVVNIVVNYILMFGDPGLEGLGLPALGVPPLGVFGLGLGSTLATVLQVAMLGYAVHCETPEPAALHARRPHPQRMKRVLALGVPVGLQMFAEVAVFAAVSFLMGAMGDVATAGHQAALMLASATFALCVGVGNATSIQVGRAVGAGDGPGQRRCGVLGLILGCAIMTLSSLAMWLFPGALVRLMTDETEVIAQGVILLRIAGVFQLVDGLQTVACGALRGLGKTRFAFAANVVSHWCIGLPTAYFLAIACHRGPEGLWWGMVAGLSTAAVVLVGVFWRVSAKPVAALEGYHATAH